MNAQSYEKQWKQVEKAWENGQPEQTWQLAQGIYDRAKKEKNTAQLLKAYLAMMQSRQEIAPDSFYQHIHELEQWCAGATEPVEASMLHLVLGCCYSEYASDHRWSNSFDAESESTDLREWSTMQIVRKAVDHLCLALADTDVLGRRAMADFAPLIEEGNVGPIFRHDLLHVVGLKVIKELNVCSSILEIEYNQEVDEDLDGNPSDTPTDYNCVDIALVLYGKMIRFYQADANRKAVMWMELERLNFLRRNHWNRGMGDADSPYLQGLFRLQREYADLDECAEVSLALVDELCLQNRKVEAMQQVREAVRRYPNYCRIDELEKRAQDIERPAFRLRMPTDAYPGEELSLNIQYKNLTKVTLQVYHMNLKVDGSKRRNGDRKMLAANYGRKTDTFDIGLLPTPDYLETDTTQTWKAPAEGLYLLELKTDVKGVEPEYAWLHVSAMRVVCLPVDKRQMEIVVLDGRTGHPVPNAELWCYRQKKNGYVRDSVLTADAAGVVRCDRDEWTAVRAVKGTDRAMDFKHLYSSRSWGRDESEPEMHLHLFTDRSIYRPGQTVYVAGWAYDQQGDRTTARPDASYEVELIDNHGKTVGTRSVRTNAYGSFATELTLPTTCLPGSFRLRCGQTESHFRVEEYKRPTFEVTLFPQKEGYRAGDTVWVCGEAKTYSGVPLQEAEVNYVVRRTTGWYWRGYGEQRLADGVVRTDADGQFRFQVALEADPDAQTGWWCQHIRVEAAVTDAGGETQDANTTLHLGNVSCRIEVDMPQRLVKEDAQTARLQVVNLDGEEIALKGRCDVYAYSDGRTRGVCLLQLPFEAGRPLDMASIKALPSGRYQLVARVVDEQGREVQAEHDFTLFSEQDDRLPFFDDLLMYCHTEEFEEDKPVAFCFGTSRTDTYVFYDVFCGDQRIESQRLCLSDTLIRRSYLYKEEYADGIRIQVALVQDGHLYQQSITLARPRPKKQLTWRWTSFRDRLQPGQQEEWSLVLTYPDGKPAVGELLATMYDASLDALQPHRWDFDLSFGRYIPYRDWRITDVSTSWVNLLFPSMPFAEKYWTPDRWRILSPLEVRYCMLFESVSPSMRMNSVMCKSMEVVDELACVVPAGSIEEEESRQEDVLESVNALRTNLVETAFFYPQLRADKRGNIRMAFTLPESLTRWHFMGLAHTAEMDWTSLDAMATAQKEFMVTPHMPRFLWAGDQTVLASTLTNLSGKAADGWVRMELFDPRTEKVLWKQKQRFHVAAGNTTVVRFAFEVKEEWTVLACRVVAEADRFSDGEQRLLPVLTDREWLSESVPLTVVGPTTCEADLSALFNHQSSTATERRLTVEFAGNPGWYAVQALSVLDEPTSDNAISWAAACYANRLAAYTLTRNPQIRTALETWRASGGADSRLQSLLERNAELKTLLLEETPWVADADNEQERMRGLVRLFDENRMADKHRTVVDKLVDLQNADGAWTWFKGMSGSWFVTQQVMEKLLRLQKLTGDPLSEEIQTCMDRAWTYLWEQVRKEYDSMRRMEKEGKTELLPSEATVQYLYLCTLCEPVRTEDKAVCRYMLDKLASSNGLQTIYGKARSAYVMQRNGRTEAAGRFLQSLREYAVSSPEKGMHYETTRVGYGWTEYRIPTQVAVIEAMDEVARDSSAVEQLKRWLLTQKRTQAWDSPLATADAVYALMQRGTSLPTTGHAVVRWGKQICRTDDSPLAYVKQTWTGKDVPAHLPALRVEKTDEGLAWGAVYGQCLERTDRIEASQGVLSVRKELLVERTVDGQRRYIGLAQAGSLHVGDKVVVRLLVRSEEDMDFVQLKDERAACLEPVDNHSGYRWMGGTGAYVAVKDASTNYFFDRLPKGNYILETTYRVDRVGEYLSGLATLQSAYAPEMVAHTIAERIVVAEK